MLQARATWAYNRMLISNVHADNSSSIHQGSPNHQYCRAANSTPFVSTHSHSTKLSHCSQMLRCIPSYFKCASHERSTTMCSRLSDLTCHSFTYPIPPAYTQPFPSLPVISATNKRKHNPVHICGLPHHLTCYSLPPPRWPLPPRLAGELRGPFLAV